MKLLLAMLVFLAFSIALAQTVEPSARALAALERVHASLEADGYKLECDAPKAYALSATTWDANIDAAVIVIDDLGFAIADTVMLEPELGVAVIDTDPDDPSAYAFGILEVGAFTLEQCWITK